MQVFLLYFRSLHGHAAAWRTSKHFIMLNLKFRLRLVILIAWEYCLPITACIILQISMSWQWFSQTRAILFCYVIFLSSGFNCNCRSQLQC